MKIKLNYIVLFQLLLLSRLLGSAQKDEIIIRSSNSGVIPAWIVTGPVEFPLVGFGTPKDTTAIGEPDISPSSGDYAISTLPENEKTLWFLQSPDNKDFMDFNNSLEWNVNTQIPVKIWYSRAGYAYTTIVSGTEQEALLTLGSNSQMKMYLNNKEIYSVSAARNALKDQDTVKIKLKKGNNTLLVRVLNTHTNLGLAFFGVIKWEWGFFARLLDQNGSPLSNISYLLRNKKDNPDFNVSSSIYFKKNDNQLKQRFDVEITSLNPDPVPSILKFDLNGKAYVFNFDSVKFGRTRHSFYLPELGESSDVKAELLLGSESVPKTIHLQNRKKYTVHLMLLNHTDVGYTNPQPVCEELHCNTLDDVVKTCAEFPDFRWTMETTWQLEAYERLRTAEQFGKLIDLIKSGRVALSPIYTNPFTGLVSEEEMLRSIDKALEYKRRFGINFNAAVYNDVPGQSWFLPQVLSKAGVKFLAEGINEVYGDYKLQRNLPKIFKWEAADGSQVVTYLNEAYDEGRTYGLESGNLFTVEQMLWERINKLESRKYGPDIILLNSSFSDNSILAKHQYVLAMKWNNEYEYPKFISSNVDRFTEDLINSKAYKELPVLKGDWTSNWDIFYQGEFERNKKERWSQHQLLSAEKLSSLTHLLDNNKRTMNEELSSAYKNMLQFTGHGSGLEFGYGSPEENKLTMEYRDNYVENARLGAESVLLKSMQMLSKPEESLDSEGLLVFNSLSWRRNDLVEFHFPFDTSPEYDVIDASDNKPVPSFRKDHRQFFIARDVPSFGYRKYLLKRKNSDTKYSSGLNISGNSIENQFYKISFNNTAVSSIIDKKTGIELLNSKSSYNFSAPTIERMQLNQKHTSVSLSNIKFDVIDERPVRLLLTVTMPDQVINKIEYTLLDNVDKVFINVKTDLRELIPVKSVEEYGIPFSFNIPDAHVKAEILGGFIEQEKDRLPGIDHDGVSVRRAVSIYNQNSNVTWATADARVIRIRKDEKNNCPVIISNPVNNFPEGWNRHEDLSGSIEFNYAFNSEPGSFNPGNSARFGYELSTPLLMRKSWFRAVPSSEEFIKIDNPDITLLDLKSDDNGFTLRLLNNDPENSQSAVISSRLFSGNAAQVIDLNKNNLQTLEVKENSFSLKLKPGEYTDVHMNIK